MAREPGLARDRWDHRYSAAAPATLDDVTLPVAIQPFAELFPIAGHALDLACGRGLAGIWLARRGMDVRGYDVSPVAVAQADELARMAGVGARCEFAVADLDGGLPAGPRADVVLCHMFRDARLYDPVISRLCRGGLLSISALSEVDAAPGRFRAKPGELSAAFDALDVIAEGEGSGLAWLLGRRLT